MRVRVLAILSLLLWLLPISHATSRTLATPPGTLVFADEFTGTALDTSTWTVLNRPGDASNSEQQCYLPSNAVEAGGLLMLTDRADTSCSGFSYTSAMVQTKSYNFTYGTFEVRAQMPKGGGQWPALWLLGANCQATNPTSADNTGACQWPTPGSNEIDLFEGLGAASTQGWFSLNTGTSPNSDNQFFSCAGVSLPFDLSTALHTYDLIWRPGSLTWQIDGQTYCSTTAHVPSTAMFIILNIALGGQGGAIDPPALPQSMRIDYVRVYQQLAGTPTSTPTGPTATATRTATRTATVTPATGGTIGSTAATGGVWDTGGDGDGLDGIRVTTSPQGAAVTALSAYVGATDGVAYGLSIYTDSGGHPGALVAAATGTLGAAGWQTLPLAATLAPNTPYWLVYNERTTNAAVDQLYFLNGPTNQGGWSSAGVTCCAFPATAPAWTLTTQQFALYATLGGAVPSSTATRTATATDTPSGTATQTATIIPTSTQTPVAPDTATATASDTAVPSDTPTPSGVLGPYGCLYPGVIYQFNSTLTGPTGVVWASPPTPYVVDPGSGPPCTPGG